MLAVFPISVLLVDVMIVFLPIIFLIFPPSVDLFLLIMQRISIIDFSLYTLVTLSFIGILVEILMPKLKRDIDDFLTNVNDVFYIFFYSALSALVALFVYTFPLFLETSWPFGSKEALISLPLLSFCIHLFAVQCFIIFTYLTKNYSE